MFFVPFTSVCEFEGFEILGIEEAADGFGMLEKDFFGSGGAVAEWAAFSVNKSFVELNFTFKSLN